MCKAHWNLFKKESWLRKRSCWSLPYNQEQCPPPSPHLSQFKRFQTGHFVFLTYLRSLKEVQKVDYWTVSFALVPLTQNPHLLASCAFGPWLWLLLKVKVKTTQVSEKHHFSCFYTFQKLETDTVFEEWGTLLWGQKRNGVAVGRGREGGVGRVVFFFF